MTSAGARCARESAYIRQLEFLLSVEESVAASLDAVSREALRRLDLGDIAGARAVLAERLAPKAVPS